MASNTVLATEQFNVVGTRPIRHDGADKVTGRAQYGADIQLPGLLFGKILRSPHAHARIKSIDASRALGASRCESGGHLCRFLPTWRPAGRHRGRRNEQSQIS